MIEEITKEESLTPRERIIFEARSWIGTRWQHQGRIKKNEHFHGGVDCAGLIIEIGKNLGFFPGSFSYHRYDRLPHDNLLLMMCEQFAIKKSIPEQTGGDILVFRMHAEPQHLGLLTHENTLIHAYIQAHGVVEHQFTPEWQSRTVAVYSYPGV